MNITLSAFAPENLVSQEGFGSPVSRQPAHLHTQAKYGAYLRDSSPVPRRRPFIIYIRQTPSGQSRVHRVTQLRTDGVHCRESAGTGPVPLPLIGLSHTPAVTNVRYRVNCKHHNRLVSMYRKGIIIGQFPLSRLH